MICCWAHWASTQHRKVAQRAEAFVNFRAAYTSEEARAPPCGPVSRAQQGAYKVVLLGERGHVARVVLA